MTVVLEHPNVTRMRMAAEAMRIIEERRNLPPTEADQLREAARERLIPFCQWTMPSYQKAPHLDYVARHLEAVEQGDLDKLIIEMPPRHGKSELISVRFPAWLLCRHPDWPIISASYGDKLASEHGRRVRNILSTQSIFPGVELSADSKAKDLWHTNQGGQFLSVGIGSGVVGFGGRVISVDDPFKKREEAESDVQRENVWNWWTSELVTRQEPSVAFVLVMHRWHEDDLSGRLQQEGGWTVIRLPALAEEGDLLGRMIGDPLWSARYDVAALERLRATVGERNWLSLYQQRPVPAEGAVFRWFHTYTADELPELRQIVVPIDTAYTSALSADYTAWEAWGQGEDGRRYLLDAGRHQGEVPEAEWHVSQFIQSVKQRWPRVAVRPLVRDSVAIDRAFAQHLNRIPGMNVQEVPMPRGLGQWKGAMAAVVSPQFESGMALVPQWAPWLEAWLGEHKVFTGQGDAHDDWVETTIVGLWYLEQQGSARPRAQRVRL